MAKDIETLKLIADQHQREKNYGLFRNSILDIAQEYLEAGNYDKGYGYLLLCAYFDLNGPNNCSGGEEVRKMLKEKGSMELYENYYFDPDNHGSVPPAIAQMLSYGIKVHGYNLSDLKKPFLRYAKVKLKAHIHFFS